MVAARLKAALQIGWAAALALFAAGADFPDPPNTEQNTAAAPLAAREAAEGLQLPPGFQATVFAAEPDVQNPIAMAWDSRGRLWIAENYTYAERTQRFDLTLRDRVVIFDDTDGDGRHDARTIFTDDVQMLTSLVVGRGGVWLMCPPRVLFIPDRDADGVPDGPAEVVLDGFNVAAENYHNFANGLKWGPDGWLYGRCGGSCPGLIGPPGTPESERQPLAGGIWRYHPTRKVVEVLATGTTNPWGHDWNEHGEGFFVNTVNGHLWHLIPGSHLNRLHTIDPNPRVYATLDQHADHWHFDTGKSWTESRNGAANALGGGHAHSGAMVYLGDNWPDEYRGRLFTLNFHGRRANQEILERSGSGYVGHHGRDTLISPDPFFRGIDLDYGPDGGVFVLDWSDTGECHESTGVHRTSGRIFKITYGQPTKPQFGDLRAKNDAELVDLHRARNAWFVRQARLILAERAASGETLDDATTALRKMVEQGGDPLLSLRALLTLHATGAADGDFLRSQLRHPDEHMRTWAIRLLSDAWPIDGILGTPRPPTERVIHESAGLSDEFARLARSDSSGLVRLALASTLQRLPVSSRAELAAALVSRDEDAGDRNLPLMVWYGLIPLADADPSSLVDVARVCRWPLTRRLIARRLAEDLESNPAPLDDLLALAVSRDDGTFRRDILDGIAEALRGWLRAKPPEGWGEVQRALGDSADPAIRDRVRELSVVFGDGRALDEVRRIVLDRSAPLDTRMSALRTLIASRPDDLRVICEAVLDENHINVVAAQGLALFDDPAIGEALVKSYRRFRAPDRPQVISVLVSRKGFVPPLLKAVSEGRIAREDLTAYHVRQIHSLGDSELSKAVTEAWGALRESPEETRQTIAALRSRLTPEVLAGADKGRGRLVFENTCASVTGSTARARRSVPT